MPVIDVTKDNFQETIDNNDKVVAKFFASWCGSCRLIKPKFKRLADDERFEGVTFIDIDAEANPDIRAKVGGQQPTVFCGLAKRRIG